MKNTIIYYTLKVFAVGGVAALLSTAAGACAFAAIKLLCCLASFVGYLAVGAFLLALVAVAASLGFVYLLGAWVVKKGHFAS